ncbi:MAG TPA: glycosyltransferase family 4 protein [Nitrospira sp.]|nr:glycosyltransferase family 4 protein [Nitrospira sp.]
MTVESKAPLRVLFVNRFYYPDLSATSRLLTQLSEDLAAHGQDITVITSRFSYLGGSDAWPEEGEHEGVTIKRVWSTHFGRRSGVGRLVDYLSFFSSAFWAVLRAGRVDWLIVLADPPMLSVLAAVAKKLLKCRAACWMQDVFPQIAIQSGMLKPGLLSGWISRVALWSLQSLDRVAVVGRCMEQKLVQEGFSGRHLTTIPNWADGAQIFSVDRGNNPFIAEQGLDQRFVLMYSGNLGIVHEVQTVENLLRCTHVLTDFTMCVIGDGAHMGLLQRMAQEEEWSHVRFLPYQPDETLRFSLAAAHVHLVTLKPEMSGLSVPSKIYGILAAGRPVIFIGPEESEAAALVREAECGYVVRPGDHQAVVKALISYRDDHALLQEHGRRARTYFEAHCSRTLGTARFVELLRGHESTSVSTSRISPVSFNGARAVTEKVVHW